MMDKHERSALFKSLSLVIKEYFAVAVQAVNKRMDGMEARLDAIPQVLGRQDGDIELIRKEHDSVKQDMAALGVRFAQELNRAEELFISKTFDPPKDGKDGRDGKDAEPVDVDMLIRTIKDEVEHQVALIPTPLNGRDGKDGKDADIDAVKEMVERQVALSVGAIALPRDGKDGIDGRDGKDAEPLDMDAVRRMIAEFVRTAVDAIPKPTDGKDADLEEVKAFITSEVSRSVNALPKPNDGLPGKDGKPGKDGESVHPDTVALMVTKEVERRIAELPKPQDGRDGIQLETVPFHEDRVYPRGSCITFAGGTLRAFRDTTPGQPTSVNGWEVILNGDGLTEFLFSEDGRELRCIKVKTNGDKIENVYRLPVLLYRGVFESGTEYQRGDVVSKSGSSWHCNAESTKAIPGESKDWQLMVKRGSDGKDLRPEEAPKNTPPIKLK